MNRIAIRTAAASELCAVRHFAIDRSSIVIDHCDKRRPKSFLMAAARKLSRHWQNCREAVTQSFRPMVNAMR
jgi:hypothetical protein